MMNYPKYESYKDSGIDWVGEIPKNWKNIRFTDAFVFNKGLTITKKDLKETGIPCISYGEVHSKYPFMFDPSKDRFQCVDNQFLKTNRSSLINYEDFIYADTSEDIEGSGNFSQLISKDNAIFAGYHTIICRYQLNDNKKFIAFFLDSLAYRHQVRQQVKGVKVYSITQSILKNTNLCLPPIQEQNLIAKFLDQKTSQIDEAIRIKEKQIELLKEQKQIMIQNAVTKGLDPNVKMKDSGVDWIGEIPEHWEVTESRWLFSQRKDKAKASDVQLTASQKFGVIPQALFMELENRRVVQVMLNHEILKKVEQNDFVISMRSFQGGIELSRYAGSVSSAYIALIPNFTLIDIEYYKWLLKSDRYIEALQSTSNLVRDGQALRFENFKMVPLIIVPIEEQKKIAKYIDEYLVLMESNSLLLVKQIEKLKEYKTTLINSAVTGKIKVTPEMVGDA